jgi:hypothetical protein
VKKGLLIPAAVLLAITPPGRYCLSWTYASICCVLSGRDLAKEQKKDDERLVAQIRQQRSRKQTAW